MYLRARILRGIAFARVHVFEDKQTDREREFTYLVFSLLSGKEGNRRGEGKKRKAKVRKCKCKTEGQYKERERK